MGLTRHRYWCQGSSARTPLSPRARSNRNGGRDRIGILGDLKSECLGEIIGIRSNESLSWRTKGWSSQTVIHCIGRRILVECISYRSARQRARPPVRYHRDCRALAGQQGKEERHPRRAQCAARPVPLPNLTDAVEIKVSSSNPPPCAAGFRASGCTEFPPLHSSPAIAFPPDIRQGNFVL